ncbi:MULTISPECIES: hypothetical protein [Gammaproteobacteria]|uniref:Uncharacterized protein n=1 Tax=Vibrio parahaemolyticus TaxID=670 RepID=A0AA46L298_VIBPH|nr:MULTISPECIES: hypothetical protein [Gammaproteobacteria]EKO3674017.1 hypothetical protein [Vibrio metschnikovii]AVW93881.1 hypothetical protein DA442_00930 [Vibrio parahaemolyticus]EGQ8736111.1 hypothetical protein [Vibrio parahaemolyticus]EGQ8905299.1 hypothetical protein [Vibrio parahaemolyticus]EGR3098361.1 hypothetical protein [Vibrio parahaemolyticus]
MKNLEKAKLEIIKEAIERCQDGDANISWHFDNLVLVINADYSKFSSDSRMYGSNNPCGILQPCRVYVTSQPPCKIVIFPTKFNGKLFISAQKKYGNLEEFSTKHQLKYLFL